MSKTKDIWDKTDIILKGLIPVSVGLMLLFWNNQRTTQQASATMTEIAIGVLSTEKSPDDELLRRWAISVLQNPSDPPRLSDLAAESLKTSPLAFAMERTGLRNRILTVDDARINELTEQIEQISQKYERQLKSFETLELHSLD